ncbi:MAG: hypothetical protein D6780_08645 [Candidatus Dadabacteria bacterium]|nr:MAG: hypothetical protein D6780_08645 [Candidatus Dadabacteria bacterium]
MGRKYLVLSLLALILTFTISSLACADEKVYFAPNEFAKQGIKEGTLSALVFSDSTVKEFSNIVRATREELNAPVELSSGNSYAAAFIKTDSNLFLSRVFSKRASANFSFCSSAISQSAFTPDKVVLLDKLIKVRSEQERLLKQRVAEKMSALKDKLEKLEIALGLENKGDIISLNDNPFELVDKLSRIYYALYTFKHARAESRR